MNHHLSDCMYFARTICIHWIGHTQYARILRSIDCHHPIDNRQSAIGRWWRAPDEIIMMHTAYVGRKAGREGRGGIDVRVILYNVCVCVLVCCWFNCCLKQVELDTREWARKATRSMKRVLSQTTTILWAKWKTLIRLEIFFLYGHSSVHTMHIRSGLLKAHK